MSTRLVILGLLKERNLYGYELKHIIESHMGDWTNIAFGSIYFALKKLMEESFVKQVAMEKEGSRPSRRVYGITEQGKKEFIQLLEELWRGSIREYYPLDIGLFFISELPREKSLELIGRRLEQIRYGLKHVEEHASHIINNPEVPAQAGAIFSHSRYHMEAELYWLEEVEANIRSGIYN